ncbi:MAG: hypothetical protein OXF75_13250 [Acidimicrobiaceae bacterium]|nr:hypothetical protein [Acidimicrobiaceae bacterium]
MDLDAIVPVVTFVVAGMGIVWHQQHNTDKLREDIREDITKLREVVSQNGERLARIEGYLRIGMPSAPDEDSDTGADKPE